MSYYKMLLVIFVVLIASVVVQGENLFSDPFFSIAYAIMGFVLVIGTKGKKSSTTANAIGMILILSVGFLSTQALIEFFTAAQTVKLLFKFAIVFSLDFCAIFFLKYGREFKKQEESKRLFGQYRALKESQG